MARLEHKKYATTVKLNHWIKPYLNFWSHIKDGQNQVIFQFVEILDFPHVTLIRVRGLGKKNQKLNLKKAALKTDLNKSDYEIDLHELQMFRNEVTEVIR